MIVLWLILAGLFGLAVGTLASDLANMDALLADQRAVIDRQIQALDADTVLIHNLRSQLAGCPRGAPSLIPYWRPDVPMITGPSGPILLN